MFLDNKDFPFIGTLEAQWQIIRDEFLQLPAESFDPWVQQSMHGEGWSVFGLYAGGEPIVKACELCPQTAKIISAIPGLSLAGFSRMAPDTHIKPHVGWAESVYRLHLGLVVPGGCQLRVVDDTRAWCEGKCWVFDDTVEHEAWNQSESYRTVLLLDFLRPGVKSFASDQIPSEVQRYIDEIQH